MSLEEMLNDAEARPLLLSVDAENFLKGTLRTEQETQGYVRPWRMSDRQYRSLGSVGAWHPGFYRQVAQCTCGIALAFTTDATRIGLEVRFDEEPLATRTMLRETDGESPQPPDGISCIVMGSALSALRHRRASSLSSGTSITIPNIRPGSACPVSGRPTRCGSGCLACAAVRCGGFGAPLPFSNR